MSEELGAPDAILRPRDAEPVIDVDRRLPAADLAPYVHYHWYVGWHAVRPHRQQVVPQPRVHVAVEEHSGVPRLLVHGISREPFFRTLTGVGHALGTAFHPGGFRPLLGGSVGALSGRVLPAADVLGVDDRSAAARILATEDVGETVAAMEEYLRRVGARPDPLVGQVRDLVRQAEGDRSLTRAEQLADRAGTSLRSLQRLFTDYVGIGPKWVIARYRVLDATAAAHSGEPVDWAALAAELGYTDQAHLTRAFTAVVGTPPATYARDA
ncbi:MAG: AraC family transcriptional regulator [Nocardioidaceae bacterium]|nr:AraC family transcriptional regulator [Nocardioidaceae bacterium]NUS50254.1 AraC family transcriptional regulator [Nocardioidaceae bacterium]